MIITSLSQLDPNGKYSYADYLTWKFDEVVELIKGHVVKMSPGPSRKHQRVSMALCHQFLNLLEDKTCQLYSAPFDVRLYNKKQSNRQNKDIFTVVQPDLCVICDLDKLDDAGCLGAPELIIEILSKGNTKREMKVKYELYQEAGVKEYWIVSPEMESIQVYVLNEEDDRFYLHQVYEEEEIAYSVLFPELAFSLSTIFTY